MVAKPADDNPVVYLVSVRPEDRRRLPPGSERLVGPARCSACHAAFVASVAGLASARDLAARVGRPFRVVCEGCHEPAPVTLYAMPHDPEFASVVRRSQAERN